MSVIQLISSINKLLIIWKYRFLGSADKTIIKWQNEKRVQTLYGHTDCVRALALLPDIGFVSCGNDRYDIGINYNEFKF